MIAERDSRRYVQRRALGLLSKSDPSSRLSFKSKQPIVYCPSPTLPVTAVETLLFKSSGRRATKLVWVFLLLPASVRAAVNKMKPPAHVLESAAVPIALPSSEVEEDDDVIVVTRRDVLSDPAMSTPFAYPVDTPVSMPEAPVAIPSSRSGVGVMASIDSTSSEPLRFLPDTASKELWRQLSHQRLLLSNVQAHGRLFGFLMLCLPSEVCSCACCGFVVPVFMAVAV